MVVGSFAFLVSSLSDRRGRAIGVIFAVLLMSFLLNFVAQFWDPFQPDAGTAVMPIGGISLTPDAASDAADPQGGGGLSLTTFSLMDYYRPAIIIQSGDFPFRDAAVLLILFAVMWSAAGVIFRRRSICTT